MAGTWSLGRLRQVYTKEESAYGVAPTLASTDAIRMLSMAMNVNAQNVRESPARFADPDRRQMYKGRRTASFDGKGMMYPSGTLNTLPELAAYLKAGFGAAPSNITLSTTLSGTPTTTGGTVASATGLLPRQPIQITIASGGNAGVYVRWLTAAYSGGSTTLAWEPALPGAPASGDAVKGTVGWAPATATTPTSLDISVFEAAPSNWYTRELLGCLVNKMSFMFDANSEPMIQLSGPAAAFAASPQAQPGAFTTVGAENAVPNGMTGYFQYGATRYEIEKFQCDIENGFDTQNTALGTSVGTAPFRKSKRKVSIKIDAKVSTDLTLWTPSISTAAAPLENTVMIQIGGVSAQIWGMYFPRVIIDATPSVGDNDETNNFSFSLTPLATSGNDVAYLAAA